MSPFSEKKTQQKTNKQTNKQTPKEPTTWLFLLSMYFFPLHEVLGQLTLQSKHLSINIKFKLHSLNSKVLPSYFLEKLILRQDTGLHFKQFSNLASPLLTHLSVQTRQL